VEDVVEPRLREFGEMGAVLDARTYGEGFHRDGNVERNFIPFIGY
jgi:hypothetical protein